MKALAEFLAAQKDKLTAIRDRLTTPDYEIDADEEWYEAVENDEFAATALFTTEEGQDSDMYASGHGLFVERGYTFYTATFIGLRIEGRHMTARFGRLWCELILGDDVIAALEVRANDKLNDA